MKPYWIEVRKRFAINVPAEISSTGKRKKEFFKTKIEASDWIRDHQREINQSGTMFSGLDPVARARVMNLIDKAGGVDALEALVSDALKHSRVRTTLTISEIIDRLISAKRAKGVGARHLSDMSSRLSRIRSVFGKRVAATITSDELETWVSGLKGSQRTRRNYHSHLAGLFNFAEARRYLAINPMRSVEKPSVGILKPLIFTVKQMTDMLAIATHQERLMLALGGFAGLRNSEIFGSIGDHGGIEWRDIDLNRNEIHVREEISKTRERIVSILPACRLLLTKSKIGKNGPVVAMSQRKAIGSRSRLAKTARLKDWPPNGLRHSFGSYHLAAFENAPLTALQMGHTNPQVTMRHYRKMVRKEEGEKWWNSK